MLDPRILSVLKEVAEGEMFIDDYGERCLHCDVPCAKDERGLYKDCSPTRHQSDCIVTIAREILLEQRIALKAVSEMNEQEFEEYCDIMRSQALTDLEEMEQ